MHRKNKKSEAATLIILVIVVVLLIGWIYNVSQRECITNKDCGAESYCGSDYSCHTYPTINKTIVEYNLFWPAVIIGFAIIIASFILKNKFGFKRKHKTDEEAEAGRYSSNGMNENDKHEPPEEEYYKRETKTP